MKLSCALKGKGLAEASLSGLTDIVTSTPHIQLKEKGAFTEATRELVRELVNRGLPVDQVNGAIQAMSAHNGLERQDTISTRSIGRIILEGGIAAQMQIIDEVNHAESDGDGTGLQNVNYESKHATYWTTLYDSPAGPPGTALMQTPARGERVTQFLGLSSSKDHTAETQMEGWKATNKRIYARVGEVAYAAVCPEQQKAADLFIWAGCCMHKELNAVKWGDTAMKAFWGKEALVGPMRLMNKDNAAAVAAGASDAQKRAKALPREEQPS
ncbi:hypothetical protein B0H34DRAFT_664489 [Crassisporium funariophilum]|nr:hypothetical protein B0H34DRAFT_664489 [Crassisporium funariophilum]